MQKPLFAAMLFVAPLAAPMTLAAEDDTRVAVDLPAMMRAHMLGNMRDHLNAIHEIQASLATGDYPKQGLCQIERLEGYGVSRAQVDTVIEIARHIRDEAAHKLDASFDQAYATQSRGAAKTLAAIAANNDGGCCTPRLRAHPAAERRPP